MNRTRRWRVAAGAAAMAALWSLAGPLFGGRALTGIEVGSWWQGGGQGPTPPQVTEGGPWVSGSASGPNAFSAIRFNLSEDQTRPVVTLRVHQSNPPGAGGLKACPTTKSWTAGTARSWAERPDYDCTAGAIIGIWSDDEATIQLDLSTLGSSFIQVAIVPDVGRGPLPAPPPGIPGLPGLPSDPTQTDPTFDISFEPLVASDISYYTVPPDEVITTTTEAPTFVADPADDFVPPASIGDLPATTLPAGPSITAPPSVALAPLAPASLREPSRTDRIMAAVVFSLLALWWWRLSYSEPTLIGPRISLHDDPTARGPAPIAAPPRQGRVPSLR